MALITTAVGRATVTAVLALGVLSLTSGCGEDPCGKYEEVAAKVDREGDYFKYEDSLKSWTLCDKPRTGFATEFSTRLTWLLAGPTETAPSDAPLCVPGSPES